MLWIFAAIKRHTLIFTLSQFSLLIVENGVADLDPKDNFGETPLRLAIKYRKYSCVTLLVKLGASLEKAKESNYEKPFTHEFDDSLKEEKTQTAIKAGQ